MIPVLAKNQGYDLDELGIVVCSISGTNFYPYLMLVGPHGLDIPVSALTDKDPRLPIERKARKPLGPNRVVKTMVCAVVDENLRNDSPFDQILSMAPSVGMFMNSYTLEIDLFLAGLSEQFIIAMDDVGTSEDMKKRMRDWATKPASLEKPTRNDSTKFLKDIETVGKGRFAQRLANIIAESGVKQCPEYILNGVRYVAERCRPR